MLLAAAVLLVPGVLAEPRAASLSWVRLPGAESCPTAAALAADVEDLLGRPVFVGPARAEVSVEAWVRRAEGHEAEIRLLDRAGAVLGVRTIASARPTCDELGAAVATAVALLLDPELPVDEGPGWSYGVEVGLVAGGGMVPEVNLGGRGEAYVLPPGFVPLRVGGELLPYGPAEAADLYRAQGGLLVCPLHRRGPRVSGEGCVGLDVGLIGRWGALSLRPFAQAHGALRITAAVAGPVTLHGAVHGMVPFVRPVVAGYQPAPVAGFAELGFGLAFP